MEIILVAAAVFGFATSVPVLAYEIYKFIDPAIKPNEKQSVYPFVAAFSILFFVGGAFAFFVLLPFVFFFSLPFFTGLGISPFIYADHFYNLIFSFIIPPLFPFPTPSSL